MKFAFIAAEKAAGSFDIEFMCAHLGVSTSGYYASRRRRISRRKQRDLELVPLIHAEFRTYPRGCGSRTIVGALRLQGEAVSRKRVVRLMAEEKLRHRLKRRYVATTQSRHDKPVSPNVLDRRFEVGAPNEVWASDITCIHTKRGWAYLAAVLDVGSRAVVGWSVGSSMEEELTLRALELAILQRQPQRGLIHHSDRGTQYASRRYQAALAEHGLISSMSRKGNCWDNAVVESFFSTLKRELPNNHAFENWQEVEGAVFRYAAAHYNTRRRHSALGYLAPYEYERRKAA